MATTRTDVLSIAYEEHGPSDGPVVVGVHGFPDDATSWGALGDRLAPEGVRVLAPALRGFGGTTFLDALGLERVVLVGQDWGARVAQGVAALHPDGVQHLVTLSSYGLTWNEAQGFPPPPVLQQLWYQWVLLLDLGEALLRYDPAACDAFFAHLWDVWSPTWPEREAAFGAVAPSFANPDLTDVVLSSYREGRADALADPRYDEVGRALAAGPVVQVPTTILLGADDGVEVPGPEDDRDARFFPRSTRRVRPAVGHFPHREAPDEVAAAVLAALQVSEVLA